MFEVFLTLCRCSEAPTTFSGNPHNPVSYTVWLPDDGETRRRLLNQDISPEASGNFFYLLALGINRL